MRGKETQQRTGVTRTVLVSQDFCAVGKRGATFELDKKGNVKNPHRKDLGFWFCKKSSVRYQVLFCMSCI